MGNLTDVLDTLQERAQALRNFRGVCMMWFKRTVNVLYTLSTSGVLGEGIDSVRLHPFVALAHIIHLFTAKPIFAGSRHWAIKDVLY